MPMTVTSTPVATIPLVVSLVLATQGSMVMVETVKISMNVLMIALTIVMPMQVATIPLVVSLVPVTTVMKVMEKTVIMVSFFTLL